MRTGAGRRPAGSGALSDGFCRGGRPVQLVQLTFLAFNTGFYMLMPYLAGYLAGELRFDGWAVGLVLGVRTLSQQGMFAIGGVLADRFGYRPVVVAGCLVRVAGFALLGVARSLPAMLAAAALSGFAGALFEPALRALLAQAAGERRIAAFALLNVLGEVGALAGPVIGALVLGAGFPVVCGTAAAVFAVMTAVQLRCLPARLHGSAGGAEPPLAHLRAVAGDRPFLAFAAAMGGYFVLFNQLYVALPIAVTRLTGGQEGTAALFALSSALFITGQVRVTAYARRWRPPAAIAWGLATMGLAFLPLLLEGTALPVRAGALPGAVNLAPVLLVTVVLTAGMMLAQPYAMDLVARFSGGRHVATYYGLYYATGGVAAAAGNATAGALIDLATRTGLPALPWLALTALGVGSGLAVALLDRRARLPAP